MADFAELGIGVDSRLLAKGRDELGRFVKAGEQAEKTTERMGRNMSATFSSLGRAAGLLGGVLATALGGRAMISTIAGFDKSMAQVQAITRATGAEMEQLRATAARLGATTEFSASQAADGLKFLGMAGFTAQQSMAAIPAVLDLATAASIGLAEAADTASNIMSGFGIEAQDAASVADVLAAAASRSNTSVSQLGSAMSTVAPISASLGISLAETAAAIGVMSDAGIQGERAGTALRGVLASLAGPTKQARDALAQMGLSAADVNPQIHSMETIFGRLQKAGMTTAQAMTIFGREASTGAIVLADGSARAGDFARELGNVAGEAGRMAGVMRDTLGGDLDTLRSTIEGLIIAIGDAGLTKAIRSVVQFMSMMVSMASSAVGAFANMARSIDQAIGGFEGYLIAASVAATAYFIPSMYRAAASLLTTLVPAVWAAIRSLVTLRGALITTGVGAFVVAAGYAINVLINLRKQTGSWGTALGLMGDVAVEVFDRVILGLRGAGQDFIAFSHLVDASFFQAMASVSEGASNAVNAFGGFVEGVINGVIDGVTSAVNMAIRAMNSMIEAANKVNPFKAIPLVSELTASEFSFSGDTTAAIDGITASIRESALASTQAAASASAYASELYGLATAPLQSVQALQAALAAASAELDGEISPGKAPIIPGDTDPGGGGGEGDGKGKKGLLAKLEALNGLIGRMEEISPAEALNRWHSDAMAALADANLIEIGMMEEHNAYKLRIEEAYQNQLAKIRQAEKDEEISGYQTFAGNMARAMQNGGNEMLKISRAFGLAEAAISMYRGAAKALELPFPASLAAWGQVIATGLQSISGIQSVRPGSSGTLGGAAGGGVVTSSPEPQPQQQERPPMLSSTITVEGVSPNSLFTGDAVRQLADQLLDYQRSGGRVVWA